MFQLLFDKLLLFLELKNDLFVQFLSDDPDVFAVYAILETYIHGQFLYIAVFVYFDAVLSAFLK